MIDCVPSHDPFLLRLTANSLSQEALSRTPEKENYRPDPYPLSKQRMHHSRAELYSYQSIGCLKLPNVCELAPEGLWPFGDASHR